MFNKIKNIIMCLQIIFIFFFIFTNKAMADSHSWWVYDHSTMPGSEIVSDNDKLFIDYNEDYYNIYKRHIEFSNNNTTLTFTGYNKSPILDFIYYPSSSNNNNKFELIVRKQKLEDLHTFMGTVIFFNSNITGSYENDQQYLSGYIIYLGLNEISILEANNANVKKMHNEGIFTVRLDDERNLITEPKNGFNTFASGTITNSNIDFVQKDYKIMFETTETSLQAYVKDENHIDDDNYTDDDLILWDSNKTLSLNKKESFGFGIGIQYSPHNCSMKTIYEISKVTMPVKIDLEGPVEEPKEEKKDCSDEEYANEHPTECATCENETFRDQNKDICTKVECYGKEMRLKDAKLLNAVIKYFKIILQLIYIGVPIILIIYGSIDFIKVMMSADKDNGKEHSKRFVKRCIYAVCLFLLGTLFNFFIDLFGIEYGNCDIPSESKVSYEINNK